MHLSEPLAEDLVTAAHPTPNGSVDRHEASGRRPGRGRSLAVVLGCSLALSVATFWAGTTIHSGTSVIPRHVTEPIPTGAVEDRRLLDSLQLSGEVAAPAGFTIQPLSPEVEGAQPLVTRLPIRVGSVVDDGSLLAEVAGQPIVALQGSIPMYRSFRFGTEGADVRQFQEALEGLGYPIADASGYYGVSTAEAASEMFGVRGYDLPTAVIGGRSKHSSKVRVAVVPAWSVVYVPHLPGYVDALSAKVGERIGSKLATVTAGRPVVRATIEASQAGSVRPGMRAEVVNATGGGPSTSAVVVRVTAGTTASQQGGGESKSGSQEAAQPEVVLDLRGQAPPLGSQVSVTVDRASSRGPVLAVPFSAVQTRADGSNYVAVEANGRQTDVSVMLGVSADGFVAVRPLGGAQLRAGERVTLGG